MRFSTILATVLAIAATSTSALPRSSSPQLGTDPSSLARRWYENEPAKNPTQPNYQVNEGAQGVPSRTGPPAPAAAPAALPPPPSLASGAREGTQEVPPGGHGGSQPHIPMGGRRIARRYRATA
ncbi:hypothetical protein EIP91_010637 [Steccherinum ochraceum]|uniref:Uncharacterized protein n=1 Tax=Steccherinum ochraceum TaxID=92696 RepID=A0A4R0RCF7_9APHY|nr:hypothetical protein EIP91_010637 [Steccherinum ochraceum]